MKPGNFGDRYWRSPLWRMRLWAFLSIVALALMEVTTTSLWYQGVFEISTPPWLVIFAILLLIYLGSSLALRGLEALHLRAAAKRAAFALWVLLAGYASLKLLMYSTTDLGLIDLVVLPLRYILRADVSGNSFLHLIIIMFITWRGIRVIREPVTTLSVHASFQFGLMALLLYGMIYAPQRPFEAFLGLYLFLFCGLSAMSMARIAGLSELRGGRIPRIGVGWVASILLAALAVIALAAAAGWLTSGRLGELLAYGLLIIIAVLTAVVLLILSPLLAYLGAILPALAEWLEKLLDRLRMLPVSRQLEQLAQLVNDVLEKAQPFLLAGRSLILLFVLAALAAAVLLALYLRQQRFRLVEEGESGAAEPERPGNLLQKLVRQILQEARRLRLRGPAQILAAARIRQIYRQLMSLSKKLGRDRPTAATPLEFLPALITLFPGEADSLELITGAYLKVRYGEYPEMASEVDRVQAAWESIRRQGRKALVARRQEKKRQ